MDAPFQLALPFSLVEAVSVRRAAAILGVNKLTLYRMAEANHFECIRRGTRGHLHIRHSSLVRYCDELRETYGIPNRRPVLSNALFRHADRDIPPFPLDQNMSVADVMLILQLEKSRVIQMASRGDIEAYHMGDNSAWRIYRPSIERFVLDIRLRSTMRRRSLAFR